jgi:hypothetical protein
VSALLDDVRSWCGGADLRDDISILAVEFGPEAVARVASGAGAEMTTVHPPVTAHAHAEEMP